MESFALTPAERALFQALAQRRVRCVLVGLSAALLEGAPVATQDLDLWLERFDDPAVKLAAQDVGGFIIPGVGMQPPAFSGPGLEGLDSFAAEFERAHEFEVDGVALRVLPLDRIIANKRATGRPKDLAALPALEAALAARHSRTSGDA